MKKTSVLHLTSDYYGGAGIASRRINSFLLQNGYESKIIFKYSPERKKKEKLRNFLKSIKLLYNFYIKFNKYCFSSLFEYDNQKLSNRIIKLNKKKKIDIICLHSIDGFISSKDLVELKKVINAKLIIMMHDMFPLTGGCHYNFECQNYLKNCKNCPAVPFLIKSQITYNYKIKNYNYNKLDANFFAFSNQDFKKLIKTKFKFKSIHQLNYPLNLNIFKYIEKKKLNKNFKILTSVTKFDPRKGYYIFQDFVKSLDFILENYNFSVEIFVCDKSLLKYKFKNIVFVYFKYKKTDFALSKIYQNMDLYINFSIADAAPLSIVENLHCGIPVLSTNVGNAKDHIKQFKNGVVLNTLKGEKFAEITKKIIQKEIIFLNGKKICNIQKLNLIKNNLKFLKVLKKISK